MYEWVTFFFAIQARSAAMFFRQRSRSGSSDPM